MIIGIVGSRRRSSEYDYEALLSVLRDYIGFDNIEKIVTGDCPVGGDEFAELIHLKYGIELDVKYKIDPLTGKKLKRRLIDYYEFCDVCYKRNEEIAKEPLDYLIAIVATDRTGGTENTIKHFKHHHKDWKEKLKIL